MKKWACVQVKNHKDVGKTIEEWQKNGWCLHTYQAVGDVGMATAFVNHYLLFERGNKRKLSTSDIAAATAAAAAASA